MIWKASSGLRPAPPKKMTGSENAPAILAEIVMSWVASGRLSGTGRAAGRGCSSGRVSSFFLGTTALGSVFTTALCLLGAAFLGATFLTLGLCLGTTALGGIFATAFGLVSVRVTLFAISTTAATMGKSANSSEQKTYNRK